MNSATVVTDIEANMRVHVVDMSDMSCFEALAYDLTDDGCWVVSEKVDLLKEEVGLRIDGYDKLLRGAVVALADNEVRISFKTATEEPSERRREIRRPVWITAIVSSKHSPHTVKCRVVDASRSGCRLEDDNLEKLPDDIDISIPGLDLPLAGKLVWRKGNQAGVQLTWPFEPKPEAKLKECLRASESAKRAEVKKPSHKKRKKISAFGN